MARVFLTGATGFIGMHTARALRVAGHEVHALVRTASLGGDHARALAQQQLSIVEGDLRAPARFANALRGIDTVVHLGAQLDARARVDAAVEHAINAESPVQLAQLARHNGVRRFVFTSSIAAMGFASGLATPASRCAPITDYGRAKLEAERRLFPMDGGFPIVVLRPPTVHGPGERYNFLMFVRAVDRGRFRLIGDGDNVFPLCSVANVARAIVAACAGAVSPGIHLVADDARYPIKRVHRAIALALGRRPPRLRIPRAAAWLAGAANEVLTWSIGAPVVLSRARVRTLTADQPFDVSSLRACGVDLTTDLEADVAATVAEQRRSGMI